MYLMEHAGEGDRLEEKTDAAFAEENLRVAGLRPGMTSIDVGCGSGAVTRLMATLTGAITVGLDSSGERVEYAKSLASEFGDQLQFLSAPAENIPCDANSFDFCWSRFFFEYQTELQPALSEMVRVAKPGGIIAVADLDGQMTAFYPQPEHIRKTLERAIGLLETVGFDPKVGRKIFAAFKKQPLENIRVKAIPYQTYFGGLSPLALKNWEAKFTQAKAVLTRLAPTEDWDAFSQEILQLLQHEDSFYYSTLIITSGVKVQVAA